MTMARRVPRGTLARAASGTQSDNPGNNDPSRGAETAHHDMIGVGLFTIDPWLFAVKFHANWHHPMFRTVKTTSPCSSRNDAGAQVLRRKVHLRQLGELVSQVELMIVRKQAAVENDRQIVSPGLRGVEHGAGEGNRTLVFSLEGCCSTIELHPRAGDQLSRQRAASTAHARALFPRTPLNRRPIRCLY